MLSVWLQSLSGWPWKALVYLVATLVLVGGIYFATILMSFHDLIHWDRLGRKAVRLVR